jgi:hypothetical protein
MFVIDPDIPYISKIMQLTYTSKYARWGCIAISAVFVQKHFDGQNAQFSWPGVRTVKEPSQTQPRLAENVLQNCFSFRK